MRRFLVPVSLLAGMGLAGCAYPVAVTEQGAAASGIYFVGAPLGADVMVDGAGAGKAASFNGRPLVLTLSPGTHQIDVVSGGVSVARRPVYVGVGVHLAFTVQ